ncbi:31920_t:CDS:2, partial [Racocetra persica]
YAKCLSKIVFENPSRSPESLQTDPEILLKEILKNPPYILTLSLEELLAPREQNTKKPPDYFARARKESPERAITTSELSREASDAWDAQSAEVIQFFTILAELSYVPN